MAKKHDNYVDYYKYIRSQDWKNKAREKRDLVGDICELCGSLNKLQVHHLTYERLGRELMEDLQVLCGKCHMRVHGINNDVTVEVTVKVRRERKPRKERSRRKPRQRKSGEITPKKRDKLLKGLEILAKALNDQSN